MKARRLLQARAEAGVSDTVVRRCRRARTGTPRSRTDHHSRHVVDDGAAETRCSNPPTQAETRCGNFTRAVNASVQEFLMDTIFLNIARSRREAKRIMEARRGMMDKATFNNIRRGLHPDSRNPSAIKFWLKRLMLSWHSKNVCSMSRTRRHAFQGLPEKWEDWEKMRRKPKTKQNSQAVSRR